MRGRPDWVAVGIVAFWVADRGTFVVVGDPLLGDTPLHPSPAEVITTSSPVHPTQPRSSTEKGEALQDDPAGLSNLPSRCNPGPLLSSVTCHSSQALTFKLLQAGVPKHPGIPKFSQELSNSPHSTRAQGRPGIHEFAQLSQRGGRWGGHICLLSGGLPVLCEKFSSSPLGSRWEEELPA